MALSLLALLVFDAINNAHGYAFRPSKQTSPAENTPNGVNGWTPKPTPPPVFGGGYNYGPVTLHELFKRSSAADVATCGWFNADAGAPLTCNAGYACAYITDPAPQWFSCCPTTNGEVDWGNCPYYSTCYPFDSYSAPNTWTGSSEYSPSGLGGIYCASASPYCNTFALTDALTSTYQFIYCDTSQAIYNIYQYTLSSSAPPSSAPTPSSSSSSSSSYSTPSSSPTTSPTTTSPGLSIQPQSATSGTATPTAGGGGGSKSNTGAIAGGVVGGVAGIALLGAAIGYLVYRKRKSRVEPMREVSIYSNNYSEPGHSNNGYSNPNTAYNGNYGGNYGGNQGPNYGPNSGQNY